MADQPQTVAIPLIQAKALQLINSDPEAFKVLQQQVDRLDPEGKIIPKSQLPDVSLDKRIASALAPLQEANARLQKALEEKEKTDWHLAQREHMKRDYKMTDAQVDELTTWMEKDADGNLFKSYDSAHRYRMAMMQPTLPQGSTLPNTQRTSAFSREPLGSEPWREAFKKGGDLAKHPLRQGRGEAREFAKSNWQKASQDFQQSRR
jgi:hypothetical protein